MASPAMFAMIAEHLPRERRPWALRVQAILKRVPVMLSGPRSGGLSEASLGVCEESRLAPDNRGLRCQQSSRKDACTKFVLNRPS